MVTLELVAPASAATLIVNTTWRTGMDTAYHVRQWVGSL
jgi:hypothetical protein